MKMSLSKCRWVARLKKNRSKRVQPSNTEARRSKMRIKTPGTSSLLTVVQSVQMDKRTKL